MEETKDATASHPIVQKTKLELIISSIMTKFNKESGDC